MILFGSFIVRNLRRQPLRSLATVLSLAVGVGVVVAIQLANVSSVRGFSSALDTISGRTSLEITSPGVGLDEERLANLPWLQEFGFVSPIVDVDVLIAPKDDNQLGYDSTEFELIRLLGIDILRDRMLRDYFVRSGHTEQVFTTQQVLQLLTDPGAILLTKTFVERHGLVIGDEVLLVIGDRTTALQVNGILSDDGVARALDGNVALMDIAAAQLALGTLGRIDRVDLALRNGVDLEVAEGIIAQRLPSGIEVGRPSTRGEEVEQMLSAFHFNLSALSGIALIVGLFLVYNTASVSVITRRSEIGMLRTIGATRRVILGLFLGEAAFYGVIGCALGSPLGWLLAHGAVGLTSFTINQFWIVSSAEVPPLDLTMVALAFVVGVPLALIAAAGPSLEAAGLVPLAAIRGDEALIRRTALPRRFILVPVVLFAFGGLLACQGPVSGLPVFGVLAALSVVLGTAFLMPAVLFGFQRLWGRLNERWFRIESRLAHANLENAIPRLAISVAALSVSIAMMVAIAIMVGSFRETVDYWVGQTLQGDLFVSGPRQGPIGGRPTISSESEAIIAQHPEVLAIDGLKGIDVPFAGSLVVVAGGRFAVMSQYGALQFKSPSDGTGVLEAAIGSESVVVSESFSLKYGVDVGSVVDLPTPKGSEEFHVVGVYFDYSSDRGTLVMDVATFGRVFSELRPAALTVYLRPGADAESVRAELRTMLGSQRSLFINTNSALRENALSVFDSTFSITRALEIIAIAVSMFGVATTLLMLVLERRREIATLRLVGAERFHLKRMIMVEAGALGLVTQFVGLNVGFVLSLILIYVINVQSFGWTIQFHLPIGFLFQATIFIVIMTSLAGLYPASLAARFRLSDDHLPNG